MRGPPKSLNGSFSVSHDLRNTERLFIKQNLYRFQRRNKLLPKFKRNLTRQTDKNVHNPRLSVDGCLKVLTVFLILAANTRAGAFWVCLMMNQLTRDDWQRIADALSHFVHNPEYKGTYEKVKAILGED